MSNNYVNPSSIYTGVITTIVNDRSMMHLMPYQNSLQDDSEPYSVAYIKRKIATTWAEITGKISDNPELQSKFAEIIDQITDLIEAQSSLFDYMGSVDTFDDLPKTGNKKGACYNVIDTGANYAWNGEEWDKLSETIDLTPYLTIETFDAIFDEFKQQNDEKFEEVNQLIDALSGDLSSELVQRLAAEETARMEADNALDAKIEEVKSDLAAHISDADANAATKTELLVAKEALEAADEALEQKLDEHIENAEMHNATKVELQELQQEVANNKTAAEQADATLQSNIDAIDAKIDAHIADADANAATKAELQAEAGARTAEDEALDAKIDQHISDVNTTFGNYYTKAESDGIAFDINNAIVNEATARENADNALDGRLDTLEAKDVVEYTDISNAENPNRKAIVFKNHDGVFGKDTEGNTRNIAMISKYNVADFGTPHLHTNLNTQQIVTVNDNQAVLTDKNLNNVLKAGDNVTIDEELVTEPNTGFVFKTYTVNAELSETSAKIDNLETALESEIQNRQDADALKADKTELEALEESSDAKIEAVDAKVDVVIASNNEQHANIEQSIADEASARQAEDTSIRELIATINSTLSGNISDEEAARILADSNLEDSLKAYVQEHTTAVFRYKGQVESIEFLPEIVDIGDTYNVIDSGSNYVWNGEEWDKLSETLDLSYLLTKEEFNQYKANIATRLGSIENSIINEATARQDADDGLGTRIDNLTTTVTNNKTALDNELEAINTTIANHISDATNTFATKEELNEYKSDNDEEIANIKDDITDLVGDYATLNQKVDTHIDHADDVYATKESVSELSTSINGAIEAEETARTNADSALREYVDEELAKKANETALSAEITARTEADTLLNNAIELKADKTALEALEDKLDEHIADASAEGATKEELQAEVSARETADEELDNKIDTLEAKVDSHIEIAATKDELTSEANARQQADLTLQENIDAVDAKLDEHIAEAVENVATKEELSNEIEARENADSALDDKIDAHIAQAQIDLNTKVDKQILGTNGKALIFNESDGGGAKFEFNNNHASFVGVNDEVDGIMAQIYAKNTQTNLGSRINVTKEGVYYTVKNNSTYSAEDEIAVKKDVAEVTSAVEDVQADLTSEIAARQQSDLTLQENIDLVDGKIDAYIEQAGGELATKQELANETSAREEAETALAGRITTLENKTESIFHFKGNVATINELPQSNNEIGDTYNVAETGSNYTWDGENWDKLSETVDLSAYDLTADREAADRAIISKIWSNSTMNGGYFQTKYTHNNGSYAQIWNESDGGGSQTFDKTSNVVSYVGTNLEEGNSDKDSAINVQIYSKDKTSNEGVRINVSTKKAYYLQGATKANTDGREIVVKDDLTVVSNALADEAQARQDADSQLNAKFDNYNTKSEDSALLAKKVDKEIIGSQGKALIFNESDGGGAKFEFSNNHASFVGVNDEVDGIMAQIYAKNTQTNVGSRLNVTKSGIYYTVQANSLYTAGDEVAVKKDITAEANARQEADETLQGNINTLQSNVDDTIGDIRDTLNDAIGDIEEDLLGVHDDLRLKATNADLNAEITARENADTALSDKIDAEIAEAKDELSGNLNNEIATLNSTITEKEQALTQAINTLDENYAEITEEIISDVEANTQAISELQDTVATKADASALDNYFDKTEVNAIKSDLENAIGDEESARQSADETLDAKIDSEIDRIETSSKNYTDTIADGLSAQLASETEAREAANTAIGNRLDTAESDIDALESVVATKANAADVYSKTAMDDILAARLASIFKYKGQVATEDNLPDEDNETGDCYNVQDTDANYAWNGTSWDKLSETIDLTPYLKTADFNTIIADYYNKLDAEEKMLEISDAAETRLLGRIWANGDIEDPTVGHFEVGDLQLINDKMYYGEAIAANELATKGDVATVANDLSDNYYTKAESDTKDAAVKSDIMTRIWSKPSDPDRGYFQTKYTHANGSYAQMWNESDGGGSQSYDKTANVLSYVGTNIEEGNSDKSSAINVQIYSKDKTTNEGVRINVNTDKAYYLQGANKVNVADREIAVKADFELYDLIADRQAADLAIMNRIWSKPTDPDKGYFQTKYTHATGSYAQMWNESDGGGAQAFDKTANVLSYVGVNMEEGQSAGAGAINVQIYSKDKTTNEGVRINVNSDKAYYLKGATKANTASREIAVKEDIDGLQTQIDNLSTSSATEVDLEELRQEVARKAYTSYVDTVDGKIAAVIQQLLSLEAKYNEVRLSNVDVIELYDGNDDYFEDREKDYIMNGQIDTDLHLTAKSVTLRDMAVNAAVVSSYTTGDFNLNNVEVDGVYTPQSMGNSIMSVHSDSYVTIRDCKITPETAYNGLEIGLTEGLAKGVIIDNVDFDGVFTNNAISIFGTAENCIITISNCHFNQVSNILRLSNRTGAKCTVNLINCTCDTWETGTYAGAILCQDYTSQGQENLFAPDKMTINIQNLIGPNGKIESVEDLSTVCGSKDNNQVLYLYTDGVGFVNYDETKYPTINII